MKSNFKCIVMAAAILGTSAICGAAQTAKKVLLSETASPPKIDGVLDDSCWESAAVIKDFAGMIGDKKSTDAAKVLMTSDDKWLYLAFILDNPRMNWVKCNVTERNSGVFADECIEIFLDPGTQGKFYYHFGLNACNVQHDRRVTGGVRDESWFVPWRSAVVRTDKGWIAEVAIPLSLFVGYGNPALAKVNFIYTRVTTKLDDYEALISQGKEHFIWCPVDRSPHEPDKFASLDGLAGKKIRPAFMPNLESAKVDNFKIDGDKRSFKITGQILNYSNIPGKVVLEVTDESVSGETASATSEIPLAGRERLDYKIDIAVSDFSDRRVDVSLKNPVTGEVLCSLRNIDTSSLALMSSVTASRNYYTSEKHGQVMCLVGLPEKELDDLCLKVKDEKGKVIAQSRRIGRKNILDFPLRNTSIGSHDYELVLETKSGTLISKEVFSFEKLKPQPGHEVKINKFDLTVMKDDKAVFPYGVYFTGITSHHEDLFKIIKENNFNTAIRYSFVSRDSYSSDPDFIKMAEKYGFMLGEWYGIMPPYAPDKTLAEKEKICQEFYARILPRIEHEMNLLMQSPNFLFHKNVDEPNLSHSDMRFMVSKMFYKTAKEIDPYRPVYGLFARDFTNDPSAFSFQDILIFDIYTYPGWGGWHSDPVKQMAHFTANLKQAAEKHRKAIMIVPCIQMVDPARQPVPLSPEDQRAQTYIALIYGAKGIIHFSWLNIFSKEMWDMLGTLGKEIQLLSPALLNTEPDQLITCSSGPSDPTKQQFAPVHARLFSHPDGGYVLLAVNGEYSPVKTRFVIEGLSDKAKVRQMFRAKQSFTVKDNSFTEEIPLYDTRAYRITETELKEPVRITLKTTRDESRAKPRYNLRAEVAQIEKQKNTMPNPTFSKRTAYENFPDYTRPHDPMLPNLGTPETGWFIDNDNKWHGHPSFCMEWVEPFENLKTVMDDGPGVLYRRNSLGLQNRQMIAHSGIWLQYYLSIFASPTPHVFSFYAKAENPGTKINVYNLTLQTGETFTLTNEWKRFDCRYMHNPEPGGAILIRLHPGGKVWINGLQMEKGTEPTEFTTK